MTWTTVEAICNCPNRLKTWEAFISNEENVELSDAKDQVRKTLERHVEEREYCSHETVEITVYRKQEVPV